jgi:hypothetical protein
MTCPHCGSVTTTERADRTALGYLWVPITHHTEKS